ncbi:PEP-CTERM sorting domain-containing protein [Pelomonas sp. KK5]|uniref:PEP-CTERM sorting domain-containing protein n=1 Tax=Pelomonas sp. KK5 TaxID=1855730 RepID=UPI00097C57EB|nr:PEP-CTERM sorting domain-containing protein [Pelomonas sp. KK5]
MSSKHLAAAAGLLIAASGAHAALSIGGLTFADDSYADQLVASTGIYTVNGPSLAAALTDKDLSTWATSMTPGASVTLRFTDNSVVNGAGDDLALFEVGHEAYEYSQEGFDSFNVTINGITRTYFTTETTTIVDDHNVNMTTLDLSFFGIAAGASVNEIQIGMDFDTRGSRPQLQLVAAIHSGAATAVPEPQSFAMLAAGLGVLACAARRRSQRRERTAS